jgi:hypothetical protein
METFAFNQEACNACKSFSESINSMLEQWCSSCAGNGEVDSVQENNPPPVTIKDIFGNNSID